MKECAKCKQSKDESLFYKNSSKKDGLQSYCKECVKENDRKRVITGENKERSKAYYHKKKEDKEYTLKENDRKMIWKHQNIDLNREINKRHYRENKLQYYNSNMKRRKTERSLAPLSQEDWDFSLKHFNYECAYCGFSGGVTVDHVIPISRGGTNDRKNIVPACSKCNSSKRDREVMGWYEKRPFFRICNKNKINEYMLTK